MITKEEAITMFHGATFHENGCHVETGPRSGKRYFITRWRKSGEVKIWKTRPEQWLMPMKHGMGKYASSTVGKSGNGVFCAYDASDFHLAKDCPVEGQHY